jgi:hypothetical protein
MKAYEWIDRLKVTKHLPSDYAAAKVLGLTQPSVIKMRARQDATLSEETAVKMGELLGLDPVGIVLDQLAERSKNESVRSTLAAEARRLCILCKVTAAILLGAEKPHWLRVSS